jgi:hypothetical protein
MVELILSFEGHIRAFPLEKATVYPLLSRTATEIRFFFKPGT